MNREQHTLHGLYIGIWEHFCTIQFLVSKW